MYLRISHTTFDPTKYDELMPVVDQLENVIRQQPGFQSYTGAVDRAAGTAFAVSLWDTEEHARFDRSVLGEVISQLESLGMRFKAPEVYDVVV